MPNIDLTPMSPRTLFKHELYLLAAMYWPYEEIEHAVAVAWLESGWRTHAHNTQGEDSRGLWQINVKAHPHLAQYNLFDPQVNAYHAYQIWRRAGCWRPWLRAAQELGLPVTPRNGYLSTHMPGMPEEALRPDEEEQP